MALLIVSLLLGSVNVWAEEEEGWVPDDAFYSEHAEECAVMDREYFANGPNETVIVYESPASSKVVKTMENGDVVLIDYTYTNSEGIEWGLCEFEGKFGWLPMPYMVSVYDYLSFEEEYADQIQEERGAVKNMTNTSGFSDEEREKVWEYYDSHRRVRFWSYPGSSSYFSIKMGYWSQTMPEYKQVFVDEDGRKWAFVTYYSGELLNRWICINSLAELIADFEELYPDGAPVRDTRVIEAYEGEEIFPDDYEHVQMMQKVKMAATVAGIVLVVAAAGVFYWKLWKKIKQA